MKKRSQNIILKEYEQYLGNVDTLAHALSDCVLMRTMNTKSVSQNLSSGNLMKTIEDLSINEIENGLNSYDEPLMSEGWDTYLSFYWDVVQQELSENKIPGVDLVASILEAGLDSYELLNIARKYNLCRASKI